MKSKPFRRGDLVLAFVEGQYREVLIDHVTPDASMAQCRWVRGGSTQYVVVLLGQVKKIRDASLPDREED